jgi:hypothetical protein
VSPNVRDGSRTDCGPPKRDGSSRLLPLQFLARAIAIIVGLTMLLVVNVRGVAFYVAWSLIVLAFLSEAAATYVYWRRSRMTRH